LLTKAFELNGFFFKHDRVEIEISLRQQKEEVFLEMKVPDFKLSERQLQLLQGMKNLTEHYVSSEGGSLLCRSKAEVIQNKQFDYSI
jgi:hypothetical protein